MASVPAALLREQRRHGQSFLICPRIQDLDPLLARVQAVAPELRIVCLHGKLPADELLRELRMGEYDVLVGINLLFGGSTLIGMALAARKSNS